MGLDSGKYSSESHVVNGLASSTFPAQSPIIDLPRLEYCETHEVVPAHSSLCLLPDLNMTPAEDDSASETLYGMSWKQNKYNRLILFFQHHMLQYCRSSSMAHYSYWVKKMKIDRPGEAKELSTKCKYCTSNKFIGIWHS